MKKITAEELAARFGLEKHPENGAFLERHYEAGAAERAASGSIYYYVAPDEITKFHAIDCDEYWCYAAGTPLQLWQIDPSGNVSVSVLGIEEGCLPFVFVKAGTVFGSRHGALGKEGTFLTCITVPRFEYRGFRLLEQDEILKSHPELRSFFEPVR